MRNLSALTALTLPLLLATGLVTSGCTPGAAAGSWVSATDADDVPSGDAFATSEEEATAKKVTAEDKATWTFFVFAKGDGVRSPALEADIASIGKAQLGSSVKVVVLADWNAGMHDSSERSMWSSGSTLYTFSGSETSTATHTDAEQDFDDPSVMSAAIASTFKTHPAKHHGLVIWARGDNATNVLGVDTQDGTRSATAAKGMTIDGMKKAIKDGVAGAGMKGDRPLDVIGFDLSSPGRIESLFALSDVAKTFVSNATNDGVGTWAYEETFSLFALSPTSTGADFAKLEDAAWQSKSKHTQSSTFAPRAHIAFDTTKMDVFGRSADSLVRAVTANPSSLARVASAASFASIDSGSGSNNSDSDRRVDFARFATALGTGSNMGIVTTAAQNASQAFANAIVGTPDSGVFGFSVALPGATSVDNKWFVDHASGSRDFDGATGWNTMIASFSKAWDKTPPTIDATFVAAKDIRVASGETRNAAATATASLIMKTNGVFLSFGHIGSSKFDQETGEAHIGWNTSVFTAGDQPARAIPWRAFDGSSTVALVGRVIIGTQGIPAAVVATTGGSSPTNAASTMFVLYPETENATRRSAFEILALDTHATFTPSVQRIDQDLNRPIYGQPIAITTQGIVIAKTPIDFGNYEVAVKATDIWGNESIITKPFFAAPF